MFREGTAVLLRHHGFTTSEHGTPAQLIATARKTPDVVVIDLDHARDDTRSLLRIVRHKLPDAHVVSLGTPVRHGAAADAAPHVEVESSASGATLAAAVNHHKPAKSSELARQHRLWARVTPRQREVLGWLAEGYDNSAIAYELEVTARAVKAHVSALLELFACSNRAELALVAHQAGLRPRSRRR